MRLTWHAAVAALGTVVSSTIGEINGCYKAAEFGVDFCVQDHQVFPHHMGHVSVRGMFCVGQHRI